MPLIKVVFPEVEALSRTAASTAQSIDAAVGSLVSTVEGIVGSTWVGADAVGFSRGFEQWHAAASEVQQALVGISVLLARSGTRYETTEDEIAARFAR